MSSPPSVEELTIAQAHNGFKTGTWTCEGLTRAFLDRIQTYDRSGPCINSTLALSTTAIAEASALDEYYRTNGRFIGRLHGIPIVVKDQADTKGIETRYGSAAAKGNIPTEDAFVVKKLKAAGAIVLAKTTMSEWASTWFSASSAADWKFTHNPYRRGFDVGGSSSGTASAVAANFAILGLGEDTGGSIRCPSSFTNLVGLRCTPGLISRSGFCPLVRTQDTPGPMARTVQDCALMLDCLVGFDADDEWTAAAVTAPKPQGGSYAACLDSSAIKCARVGVIRELFGPDSDPHSRSVNRVVASAIEKLALAGAEFVDVALPGLKRYLAWTPAYVVRSRSDINSFLATKPHLPQDIADIVPAEPPHPTMDFTSMIAHGPAEPLDDPTYASRLLDRDELQRRIVCLMAANNLDALAFPDVQIPAPRHSDALNGRFPTCWDFPTNTLLASQSRLPAITVPVGFTDNGDADDGLPVGLEFLSWEYREEFLLTLACGVESLIQARRAPVLDDLVDIF